jgi:hypothetical protein
MSKQIEIPRTSEGRISRGSVVRVLDDLQEDNNKYVVKRIEKGIVELAHVPSGAAQCEAIENIEIVNETARRLASDYHGRSV